MFNQTKNQRLFLRPQLLLPLALCFAAYVQAIEPTTNSVTGKELWLFGGGEPICSSVEITRCAPDKQLAADAYFSQQHAVREKHFRPEPQTLNELTALTAWPASNARQQQVKPELLTQLQQMLNKSWPEDSWYSQFKAFDLSDDEQNLLDDIFEQRPVLQDGSTAQVKVYFDGTELYVQQMFQHFIQSAKNRAIARAKQLNAAAAQQALTQKPTLVLITASSNSSMDWVDYYLQLFNAAGANAVWLPIEPALVQEGNCETLDQDRFRWNGQYKRAARYPELAAYQQKMCREPALMTQLLEQADAIFINGGDQSHTMRSLQKKPGEFTELAQLLHQRINAGVPLAGSSAGTAVQSGHPVKNFPMISGGQTSKALRYGAYADEPNAPLCQFHQSCSSKLDSSLLTYRVAGGLQSFTLGVTDTHFRERNREGRLLRLLIDTNTNFGFGMDEATALRANFTTPDSAQLQVEGRGGVWIADVSAAKAKARKLGDKTLGWAATGMTFSRLLAGDTAYFQNGIQQATLQCDALALVDNNLVAADTYNKTDGRVWQAKPGTVEACKRADGRWRYLNLPMSLQVNYE
ncbi:cyanophycinase [Rheinheimera sp. D18]|uniref:cyanophycinase n=1 Tax=Rheinheimera sp. D18 TaxID=2545632 RepID=UPI0014049D11|nr:cyanophycinase [Rheinheimera sp. D18]